MKASMRCCRVAIAALITVNLILTRDATMASLGFPGARLMHAFHGKAGVPDPTETRRTSAKSPHAGRRAGSLVLGIELDVLKVRGGQFAALAYNVVREFLSLMEVGHSGTLDCGTHARIRPVRHRSAE